MKNKIEFYVNGVRLPFLARTLAGFPEAERFAVWLHAHRKCSLATIHLYVKLAAKLKREGQIREPSDLVIPNQRTVATAYADWLREAFDEQVNSVCLAVAPDHPGLREKLPRTRVHSLVPPFEGKQVWKQVLYNPSDAPFPPRPEAPPEDHATYQARKAKWETQPAHAWMACSKWTLHVPREEETPPHDEATCTTCDVIELDDRQLEAVAAAFERAWGHRELTKVAPEQPLFGALPDAGPDAARAAVVVPPGRPVAAGTVCRTLDQWKTAVQTADGVYLDRTLPFFDEIAQRIEASFGAAG